MLSALREMSIPVKLDADLYETKSIWTIYIVSDKVFY